MVVLDTDLLSIIQKQSGETYRRLVERLSTEEADAVCITVVSLEEQTRGWLSYIARARTPSQLINSYRRLHDLFKDSADRRILDFDEAAAEWYFQLLRQRIRIGTMDLRIASIALAHEAMLITRNVRHFQMVPRLQVEDWALP